MIDCPPSSELKDLLAGRLAAGADAALSDHIEGCASCQRRLERMTDLAGPDLTDPGGPASGGRLLRLLREMGPPLLGQPGNGSPDSSHTFLGASQFPGLDPPPSPPSASGERNRAGPERVGRYEVVRELGRGGMGVVFLANDPRLKRPVALKMILAAEYAGPEVRLRFQTEAEAVARLRHPNIVPIYEVGEQDGRPYIALEFVGGGSLNERNRGQPQSPRTAAELVRTLALALDHAHRQGIIHRDLKPGNILLAEDGTPKIADFGLAKFVPTDDPAGVTPLGLSATGAVLGTPSYMAPEQAGGQVHAVTPATDVYALGAILYELLTGRPPFHGVDPIETVLQVNLHDPVSPRALQHKVPRDLETICLKCLQKDPAGRYATAAALADDLGRHLNGEPVLARPVPAWERCWRWLRRRPVVAASLVAVVAVTLLAVAGVTAALLYALAGWNRAERAEQRETGLRQQAEDARDRAVMARAAAESNAYFARIAQAWSEWRQNDPAQTAWLLEQCRPHAGEVDRRGWEWGFLHRLIHADLFSADTDLFVGAVAFRPDGGQIAAASGNPFSPGTGGGVRLWDLPGGKSRRIELPAGMYTTVAYSPDGHWLAAGGWKGGVVYLCALETVAGKPVTVLQAPIGSVFHVAFSPGGHYLAATGRAGTYVWDRKASTGTIIGPTPAKDMHEGLSFSPDEQTVAVSRGDSVYLYDPASGQERRRFPGTAQGLAFGPAGRLLAIGDGAAVRVVGVDDGRQIARMAGHDGPMMGLAFATDGRSLATVGADRVVRIWDVDRSAPRLVLRGHTGRVACAAFHPDGKTLVTGSQQPGKIKVWDVTVRHQEFVRLPRAAGHALAFTTDGQQLRIASGRGVLEWNLAAGTATTRATAEIAWDRWPATLAALSSGGRICVGVDGPHRRAVHILDVNAGQELARLGEHSAEVIQVAVSLDGRRAATTALGRSGTEIRRQVIIWNVASGGRLAEFLPTAVRPRHLYGGLALSPDGEQVAYDDYRTETGPDGLPNSVEAAITVRDVASGRTLSVLTIPRAVVASIVFSPDGRVLAVGDFDGHVHLWTVATAMPLPRVSLDGPTEQIVFSPDGRRLAGVDRETVKLWDVASGHEVFVLRGAEPRAGDVPFNPQATWSQDGLKLATTNHDGSVSIWEATDWKVPAAR
jgi:eukaryotic-like serine/threonine-protein kinase